MKIIITLGCKSSLLIFALLVLNAPLSFAQITIVNDLFEDGNITANPEWFGNTSKFTVSSSSPLEGNYSLVSNTGDSPSSISAQFGVNSNLSGRSYTWNLLYRSPGTNNHTQDWWNDNGTIPAGKNYWRYWIAANQTNVNTNSTQGYFLDHSGNQLRLINIKNNSQWTALTYTIATNTTYSIKITRYQNGTIALFIDEGTAEATTQRGTLAWFDNLFQSGSNNLYMIMHASETSPGRFKWDKLGLFSKVLTISPLAGMPSQDIQQGSTNIPIIGFKASATGLITLKKVRVFVKDNQGNNVNMNQGFYTNFKLIKSEDEDFYTTDDNTVLPNATFQMLTGQVYIRDIERTLNNSGENYFVVMDFEYKNAGDPPSSMNFFMTCTDCGPLHSNVETENEEAVGNFTPFYGPSMGLLRVFIWKNTSGSQNWTSSNSWEPNRGSPADNDVLEFSKGGAVTPTSISSLTAGKIVIKGNTQVSIPASSMSANTTFIINANSNNSFEIENGSSLNISSNDANKKFTINLTEGAEANIEGDLLLSGQAHVIKAAEPSAINFKPGSVFTGGSGLSGNPFGNEITGSIVFEDGALLVDETGNVDYFSPANVITMSPNSTYRFAVDATPDYNNKTFGNVEVSSGKTLNMTNNTYHIAGDLQGAGNITLGSGTINLDGDFSSSGSFTAGTGTINYKGDGDQNVRAANYYNLKIDGSGEKNLNGNITVNANLMLSAGLLDLNNNTLNLAGTTSSTGGAIRGGSCANPSGNINITGSGSLGELAFDNTSHFLGNVSINRNGSSTFDTKFGIGGTLSLVQGELICNDILYFGENNIPVSRTNGTLTLGTDAGLYFGACGTGGNAFTLPNNLFTSTTNFKDLTLNRTNGMALGNQMLNLNGTLKISSGTLQTNANLTLLSTAEKTARVDSILCETCGVSGNVHIQRFIPGGAAKRKWRILAMPVNQGGSLALTQLIDDIHVTGPGGSANGFDDSPNNSHSIKTYDEQALGPIDSGWAFPSNINHTYPTGKGFFAFIRGNRETPDPFDQFSIANDATITYTGALNMGFYSLPVSYNSTPNVADGMSLVANPYASAIDWAATNGWIKTNVQNKVWLYNPLSASYGIYDANLGVGTNGATRYIASGQGFLVKAINNSVMLSITERAKVDAAASDFFRPDNSTYSNILKLKVEKDSITSDEAILVLGENYSGNFDESDAQKLFSDNLNFYFKSKDNINLAINTYPIPAGPDTIKMSIFSYLGSAVWEGDYTLRFDGSENVLPNVEIYFEDLYAGQLFNIRDVSEYTFSIVNAAGSTGNDRFRLLLNYKPTGVSKDVKASMLSVFPNPFDHKLEVHFNESIISGKASIEIYNTFGQFVKSIPVKTQREILDLQELPMGIYLLKCTYNGKMETHRVLKQ